LDLPSSQNQYCLSVYPSSIDREKAKVLLNYDSSKRYVFIQPGASVKVKQWHPDFFRKVVGWLDQKGLVCVFAGSQKEKELIELVSGSSGGVVKLGYNNTVMELASVLYLCDLVVTNDTGPMHVAEALNRPMICFFWDNHVIPAKPITHNWLKIYESEKSSSYIIQPKPESVIKDIQSFLR
ncbi:MAG: glycosyltransferase family 9 protein, partial [Candidatus Lariskella arthropodorum]